MPSKRIVNMNVVHGQPTDGSGGVCIHLFVPDPAGSFTESSALHQAVDENGQPIKQQLVVKPTRGRLACDPRRKVAPVVIGNVTTITPRTDDPRATTCPRCRASEDYKKIMAKLEGGQ